MSSLPGLTLEDFVAWNQDLRVIGQADPNFSLAMAEAMGTAPRPRLTLPREAFALIIALYEPYRRDVEERLADFNPDTQSWRDYAMYCFDFIPGEVHKQAALLAELQWPLLHPTFCERCPYCGNHGSEAFHVLNYDSVWRDGDVHCRRCDKKVRNYDAG